MGTHPPTSPRELYASGNKRLSRAVLPIDAEADKGRVTTGLGRERMNPCYMTRWDKLEVVHG